MRKQIGAVLIVLAIISFLVNFGLFSVLNLPSIVNSFFSLQWLWNPLSMFTQGITGGVPLVGGVFGSMLNYIWAVIYSGILLVLGAVLVK